MTTGGVYAREWCSTRAEHAVSGSGCAASLRLSRVEEEGEGRARKQRAVFGDRIRSVLGRRDDPFPESA